MIETIIELEKDARIILEPLINSKLIEKTIYETLSILGVNSDISCAIDVCTVFCNEEEIQRLNKQYRGINSVTDVLSFPMYSTLEDVKSEIEKADSTLISIGDIVICFKRAEEQAAEYGHSLEREIAFLTAHSVLHLMGFDHVTKEDEKEMFVLQEKVLKNLSLRRYNRSNEFME